MKKSISNHPCNYSCSYSFQHLLFLFFLSTYFFDTLLDVFCEFRLVPDQLPNLFKTLEFCSALDYNTAAGQLEILDEVLIFSVIDVYGFERNRA